MRVINILGSTGSIGTQALQIAALHPDKFKINALTAHRSVDALFAQVRAALLGEERPPEPTLNQRMTALRDQIYEMCEEKGEWAAMPQARSQAMHYMKGLKGAASLRRYCSMLEHFTDVDKLIEAVYKLQG